MDPFSEREIELNVCLSGSSDYEAGKQKIRVVLSEMKGEKLRNNARHTVRQVETTIIVPNDVFSVCVENLD